VVHCRMVVTHDCVYPHQRAFQDPDADRIVRPSNYRRDGLSIARRLSSLTWTSVRWSTKHTADGSLT
jgi:hypothetical protein